MDENKEVRVEGFFEAKCKELENQVKVLQFVNAELETKNKELFERVNKLATRHPQWPAGYRPRKHFDKDPRVSK
jgi:exonuclease VII small subunit